MTQNWPAARSSASARCIAALGRWGVGAEAEVRRPDALGARIDAAIDNPWFDAAVVPAGVGAAADDPRLPHCLWTVADSVPGRVEEPGIATPCLAVALDDPALVLEGGATHVEAPSLAVLGEINERAYGQSGVFGPFVQALRDDRIRTHGLREAGEFVCVALTLAVGDDLSIQYVATEASYRRRGLASQTVARDVGRRTGGGHAQRDAPGQPGRVVGLRTPRLPPRRDAAGLLATGRGHVSLERLLIFDEVFREIGDLTKEDMETIVE